MDTHNNMAELQKYYVILKKTYKIMYLCEFILMKV